MPRTRSDTSSKELIHVRLERELVRDVDHLAVDWGVYRAEAIERLLHRALESLKRIEKQD